MRFITLKDIYLSELQDMHDRCGRIIIAIADLRSSASHQELRGLIAHAAGQGKAGLTVFRTLLAYHGVASTVPEGMGLRGPARTAATGTIDRIFGDRQLCDLAIVAEVRHLTHYAKAGLAALEAHSERLGLEDDFALLKSQGLFGRSLERTLQRLHAIESAILDDLVMAQVA